MGDRFRITLTGKNLYKEVELLPEMKNLRLGTGMECDVRLRREQFFEAVELSFVRNEDNWMVLCANNLFISTGDARKLFTLNLSHGSTFSVCYQNSGIELFSVEFIIDFENETKKLTRCIDVSEAQYFSIGVGGNNHISLHSRYLKNDEISCIQSNGALTLTIRNTTYGVYVNGRKVKDEAVVSSGDFFSLSDAVFYYRQGTLWVENSDLVQTSQFPVYSDSLGEEYPRFNRNTRIKIVPSDEKIEILDPPQKPEKPKANLFQRLFPSLGMLIAAGIMAYMGGATMLIFSGVSALMAIITAIVSIIQGNKDYKKRAKERIEKYETYITGKKEEISRIRAEEKKNLEEIYCSESTDIDRAFRFSSDMFDRTQDDEDFLCVRLGLGAVPAIRKIEYKKQEKLEIEDDLQMKPVQICEEYEKINDAPVVCDFKAVSAVGVIGTEESRQSMLDRMILDICSRHYYSDVKVFFVSSPEHEELVWRYRMLPFVYNDELKTRNIVCNEASKNLLFEYLFKELSSREHNKSIESHLIIMVLDDCGLKTHPISRFISRAKDIKVTFVFFAQTRADIAQGCGYLINMSNPEHGVLIDTSDRNKETEFSCSVISQDVMARFSSLLAPIYTQEISLEGSLTRNITLFQLLNILSVGDIDLSKRWGESKVFKSMAAPLGVSKTGVVYLNLHDRYHGPHGLVAGTTGSGKSELLQSYVLSMATLFHPHEVGFVIIDFKGGGMANQFRDLPHLMGSITNIDGREINRSLKSIKAELQKRQRLFADADVNHIDKYIQKYKAGEVKEALPHLIIIVDEFAELKAEQPEFMKELISAARIGRSLGVHLILATQKPAGQVNEQIWSNSRFKLCLKVQGPEDSNEVLKSPLAAEIKEPGRAYLQVGNNEVFELFQSAYSGAPEHSDETDVKEYTIFEMSESGRRIPVYQQKKQKKEEGKIVTQLDALVKYVSAYCQDKHIEKLPNICLPSLSHNIPFPEEQRGVEASRHICVDIGIYDDPDNQFQGTFSVDFTTQNTIIIGSAQTGKTNVLQAMIRGLSSQYSPREVSIYIIDFASMVLKNFETLNHVGGVVIPSQDEKLKNLIKLLMMEIKHRKEKMLSAGVSSFAAYKEAGKTDLPQIILMIDNLTSLKEMYFQDDDDLLTLCREGIAVGISVVIANSQTAGIGYKYLANFAGRIALFCNDSGEYCSLFNYCREKLVDIPGRCLVEIDKSHLECQAFMAFSGEKEIERITKIYEFIDLINKQNSINARRIPMIPETMTQEYIWREYPAFMDAPGKIVLGVDYSTVEPLAIQLNGTGAFGLAGRAQMGKNNFVRYIAYTLAKMYPNNVDVYVCDGVERKLGTLKESECVIDYELRADRAIDIVISIGQRLEKRYQSLADNIECDDSRFILLIINSRDAVEAICSNSQAMASYNNIVGKYKSMGVCIIIADIENVNISYSAPEIYKKIRETKQLFFFDDIDRIKIIDIPLMIVRSNKKPLGLGDCFFIRDNECKKIKTPFVQ